MAGLFFDRFGATRLNFVYVASRKVIHERCLAARIVLITVQHLRECHSKIGSNGKADGADLREQVNSGTNIPSIVISCRLDSPSLEVIDKPPILGLRDLDFRVSVIS